jgi:hypothetical protein
MVDCDWAGPRGLWAYRKVNEDYMRSVSQVNAYSRIIVIDLYVTRNIDHKLVTQPVLLCRDLAYTIFSAYISAAVALSE